MGQARKNNEDTFCIETPDEEGPSLYIVADGVGGARFGEVASDTAVSSVFRQFKEHRRLFSEYTPERDQEMRNELLGITSSMIEKANEEVYQRAQADRQYSGMCTTMVVLVTAGHGAFLGHVGDSRAYLLRGGGIYRLTEDQTWANYMAKIRDIDPLELKDHPYANVLAKSVGSQPHVEPDTGFVQVEHGDRFIICSDGLTRYLSGSELNEFSANSLSPEDLVTKAIREANGRGGRDNITAITIEAEGGEATLRNVALRKEIELLKGMFLFERFSDQEIMSFMRIMYKSRRPAGEVIIREGEVGDELHIVAEGLVDVTLRGARLNTIEAGGHFGELALIDNETRSATVSAKSAVTLMTIKREDFASLIRKDHQLAEKLLWSFLTVLAGHVRSMSQEVVSFASFAADDGESTIIDTGGSPTIED